MWSIFWIMNHTWFEMCHTKQIFSGSGIAVQTLFWAQDWQRIKSWSLLAVDLWCMIMFDCGFTFLPNPIIRHMEFWFISTTCSNFCWWPSRLCSLQACCDLFVFGDVWIQEPGMQFPIQANLGSEFEMFSYFQSCSEAFQNQGVLQRVSLGCFAILRISSKFLWLSMSKIWRR